MKTSDSHKGGCRPGAGRKPKPPLSARVKWDIGSFCAEKARRATISRALNEQQRRLRGKGIKPIEKRLSRLLANQQRLVVRYGQLDGAPIDDDVRSDMAEDDLPDMGEHNLSIDEANAIDALVLDVRDNRKLFDGGEGIRRRLGRYHSTPLRKLSRAWQEKIIAGARKYALKRWRLWLSTRDIRTCWREFYELERKLISDAGQ